MDISKSEFDDIKKRKIEYRKIYYQKNRDIFIAKQKEYYRKKKNYTVKNYSKNNNKDSYYKRVGKCALENKKKLEYQQFKKLYYPSDDFTIVNGLLVIDLGFC